MRTKAGHNVDHRRGSRLKPVGELEPVPGAWQEHRARPASVRELGVLVSEKDRFQSLERNLIGFTVDLKISHPVLPDKGPGISQLRICIHLRFSEAGQGIDAIDRKSV